MNGSKSFGVRMPLEMYLKMVEVCSKNGVTQTDLVLYALNRVGLFSDDFKVGGEVEIQEKIVYRNEPELLHELKETQAHLHNKRLENGLLLNKLKVTQNALWKAIGQMGKASELAGKPKEIEDAYFELNTLAVKLTDEEL
jgi:hypothetical protein